MRVLGVSLVVVAACTSHEHTVPLSFFDSGTFGARTSLDGGQIDVFLGLSGFTAMDNCPVLADNIGGTIDDMPLTVIGRGGYWVDTRSSGCDVGAALSATPGASTAATNVVTLTDGKTTYSATFRALRVPRGWSVGSAQRGATATFTWAVATDLPAAGATGSEVDWVPDQGTGFYTGSAGGPPPATLQGLTAVFQVPADAATGPGVFHLFSYFDPAVVTCDGVATCLGELSYDPAPAIPATIAP